MIKLFKTTILSVVIIIVSCTTDNEKLEADIEETKEAISQAKKSSLLKGSEFITTWEGTEITIPTNSNYTYNYNVDWNNDGIVDETGVTGDVTHTFNAAGKHTIRISGVFPAIHFFYSDQENRDKIVSIDQWGAIEWLSMEYAFYFCSNLELPATDVPNLRKVTNTSHMFNTATMANPDVSKWDVSNVVNMNAVFGGLVLANPNVSHWDVSNVTNMSAMFSGAELANPDVSNWDVSNVENMNFVFMGATSANPNVSNWDVSNVTTMFYMFFGAKSANPDVSRWNIGKVKSMDDMLRKADSFTTTNYEGLLINFAGQPHPNNVVFETTAVAISAEALAARQVLIDHEWIIYDGSN